MSFLLQYFADCNEISTALDEIDLAASNDDLGQDEESVEELSKKHMVMLRTHSNFLDC